MHTPYYIQAHICLPPRSIIGREYTDAGSTANLTGLMAPSMAQTVN